MDQGRGLSVEDSALAFAEAVELTKLDEERLYLIQGSFTGVLHMGFQSPLDGRRQRLPILTGVDVRTRAFHDAVRAARMVAT